MNKEDIIMAGLSTMENHSFSPVQAQKLFFLIDKTISNKIGGPYFNFQPYNYGPFDKEVYLTLENLSKKGLVEINKNFSWNTYRLTEQGQAKGKTILSNLKPDISNYIKELTNFVCSLSFTQLVSTIYKAYPDMKVNSVFQE